MATVRDFCGKIIYTADDSCIREFCGKILYEISGSSVREFCGKIIYDLTEYPRESPLRKLWEYVNVFT